MMEERLGRYRLIEAIGSGGMATVYRTLDTTLNRTVALKVLAPWLGTNPEFVARFEHEAVLAANLRHPSIVTVYDVGEENGRRFMAMEYVPGKDLRAIIREAGALPVARAGEILAQVAAALDYAHREGVVHRDVKPSNILIEPERPARLADFGIAKALGSGQALTGTHMHIGSPFYMSPEQAEGRPADARSDIYSLGIVVYEMLSGQVPFLADTTSALLYAHVHQTPPSLAATAPRVPGSVERVVFRALAKRPADRYQTAGEFAQAYARATGGRSPAPASPRNMQSRRSPLFIGIAALLLLGGAAAMTQGFRVSPLSARRLAAGVAGRVPEPVTAGTPGSPATARTPSLSATPPLPTAGLPARVTPATAEAILVAEPTATPLIVASPIPTATREPVIQPPPAALPSSAPAPFPTVAATSTAVAAVAPALFAPADGDTTQSLVTFSWKPVSLPAGAQYEVVVWDKNEPAGSARGVHAPVSDTSLAIDIAGLFAQGTVIHTPEFNWSVLVVATSPQYARLVEPSNADGPRRLTYTPSSRGGSGGPSCTGPGCK